MKIALDFDEVVANLLEPLLKEYNQKNGKSHKIDDFESYDWWTTWGITREEAIQLIDDFHENQKIESIEPIEKAVESITSLLHNGDKLFIITARPTRFNKKTGDWIKYHLKTDKIEIIHSGDFHKGQGANKSQICKELGIKIILEDSGETALKCAEIGIKVLLFDKPWNKKFKHENMTRVAGWEEATKKLQNYSKT
ncbi:hypothetical protein J4423_01665 [Candidatus Pacearchaeota archaeon]|nr:hypothetical protein [Candidatus Pacearchaeota archaeon]